MSEYKTRVLLVEDEELARKTLGFYLNTIFDEVEIACDGQEGIDFFKNDLQRGFDLVLTDIKMPNKDGMKMIDEMLELKKDQRFIIVSAFKEEEDLLKLINLRVLGYFVKPLNIDNMMEMLKKAKEEVLFDYKSKNMKTSLDDIIKLNKIYSYKISKDILYKKDVLIKLSNKEAQILKVLITNIGEVVPVTLFKKEVWDDENTNDSAFRTVMKRLKDKLKENDFIVSYKGKGYIINQLL